MDLCHAVNEGFSTRFLKVHPLRNLWKNVWNVWNLWNFVKFCEIWEMPGNFTNGYKWKLNNDFIMYFEDMYWFFRDLFFPVFDHHPDPKSAFCTIHLPYLMCLSASRWSTDHLTCHRFYGLVRDTIEGQLSSLLGRPKGFIEIQWYSGKDIDHW